MRIHRPIIIIAVSISVVIVPVHAATWTGAAGNGSWTNDGNWLGGLLPEGGSVVFDNNANAQLNQLIDRDWNITGVSVVNPAGNLTIGGGNVLTNGSGGIDMSSATADLILNAGLNMNGNQSFNVATNRTLTLGGTVNGAGTLTKSGPGAMVISGTYNGSNGVNVVGGTMTWKGTAAASVGMLNVSNATVAVDGGSLRFTDHSRWYHSLINVTNGGVMAISTHGINSLFLQNNSSLNISSGGLSDYSGAWGNFYIGNVDLGTNNCVVSGTGNLTMGYLNTIVGNGNTVGILTIRDSASVTLVGIVTAVKIGLTVGVDGRGIVNVNGGTLTAYGITLGLNAGGTGDLNISNGSVYVTGTNAIASGSAASSSAVGTLNMCGGELYLNSGGIAVGASNSAMNVTLSGGVVGALSNWSSSVPMTLTNLNGDVTLQAADTNNIARDITLSGTLSGTGGFIKTGIGKLVLSGTNTFAGATVVSNGVLRLENTNSLSPSTSLFLSGGATNELAFIGTNTINALYVDGKAKTIGVYGRNELPASLSGTGYLRTLWPPPEGTVIVIR